MKIAHLGASGNVGSKIVAEALRRGHTVTAIVRHPEAIATTKGLTAVRGDVADPAGLAQAFAGHDVVVSSTRFQDTPLENVVRATKEAGVPRFVVVGGAGSLRLPDGTDVVDAPSFPEAYKPEALPGRAFLHVLRAESDLDWTMLSPSAEIAPGVRTGQFRLGNDDLLVDEGGKSHISQEDFAVALVDELENPQHSRARFTVGY